MAIREISPNQVCSRTWSRKSSVKLLGCTGKTINDVDEITIFSHSAGYNPSGTEIYKNGLEHKVKTIALLDSLYRPGQFDEWIRNNSKELANGTKRFYNFFNDTSGNSKDLASRIHRLAPGASILIDYNNPSQVLDASKLAANSIVFKYSTAKSGTWGPHLSMPRLYVGPVEQAANQTRH